MSNQLTLKVAGNHYQGWKSASITKALDHLSGSFELGLTTDSQQPYFGVKTGDACEVLVGDEVLIKGYIDQVQIAYDDTHRSLTVTGRDNTADIIDCSAKIQQYTQQTLADIAADQLAPFGIGFLTSNRNTTTNKPFNKVAVNPGETVHQLLDRLARLRALLLISHNGQLLATTAGSKLTGSLQLGRNIKQCDATFNAASRYQSVTVRGQSDLSDSWNGAAANQAVATAYDNGISRHRPLDIVAEDNADVLDCQTRAAWEIAVRYGRVQTITYTVSGWQYSPSALWRINNLVTIFDDFLQIEDQRLITAIKYTLGKNGEQAAITVMPPSAYQLIAGKEPQLEGAGF